MKQILFIIACFIISITTIHAQTINYCIRNARTTGSSPMHYEFDVYVNASSAGLLLSDGIFYLNYNTTYFGTSTVGSGRLSVDRDDDRAILDMRALGTLYMYNPILTADNTSSRFGVIWELTSGLEAFAQTLPSGPTNYEYLCHVRMEIVSPAPDLEAYKPMFHLPLMNRETFYYDAGMSTNFPMNADAVCPPLPIELSYFKAEKDERTSILKWHTATEINSSHFNIQRSTDGQKWENIGKVSAVGESQTARNYHFTDTAPFSGDNYYRLQQVDIDGTSEYSSIEVLKFEDRITDGILVYPNPVAASFYVEYPYDEYEILSIKLFDIHGKKVFSQQTNSTQNRWQIDTNELPLGAYFLHLITPTETITRKVIKQ